MTRLCPLNVDVKAVHNEALVNDSASGPPATLMVYAVVYL